MCFASVSYSQNRLAYMTVWVSMDTCDFVKVI